MFTQECFIRKNTEKLIYSLCKLGYEYYRPLDGFKNNKYVKCALFLNGYFRPKPYGQIS